MHREWELGQKVCLKCFFTTTVNRFHFFFCLSQKGRNEKWDSFYTAKRVSSVHSCRDETRLAVFSVPFPQNKFRTCFFQRYVVVPHPQNHRARDTTSSTTSSPKTRVGHAMNIEISVQTLTSWLYKVWTPITTMKLKGIDAWYFVQETWLEGDVFDEIINGFHVFCHNGEVGHHNFRGVAIILSPRYPTRDGTPREPDHRTQPMWTESLHLNIKLASNDCLGKKVQGKQGDMQLNLTLVSAYHPCT